MTPPNFKNDEGVFWERATKVLLACTPMERTIFEVGSGAWLKSTSGRSYLDLGSGQVCALMGHSPQVIADAIARQAKQLIHLPGRFASPHLVTAAEEVLSLVPEPLAKVAFLSTGTEANEFAVRLAKLATQRDNLASPRLGYLGTSHLMRGLSAQFIDEASLYPPPKGCQHFDWGDGMLSTAQAILKARESLDPVAASLAAVITEPILGTHGIIPLPKGFLQSLKQYLTKIGALLILDEAQTGLGRTGKWFAFQHDNVTPDILVFSKCAGGGYPLACVVVTEEVASRVSKSGFFYLSSHQADPLGLAALIATLEQVKSIDAPSRSMVLGELLKTRLQQICETSPILSKVTGKGLLLGVHCNSRCGNPPNRISRRLYQLALEHNVIMGYGDWAGKLLLAPPMCINESEIDIAGDVLELVCRKVEEECQSGKRLPRWREETEITKDFLDGLNTFNNRPTGV